MKVGITSLILWLGLPCYQRACSFSSLLSLLIGTTLVGSNVISAMSDGKSRCSFLFVSLFSYSERLVYFPWLLNWHIYRGSLSSFFLKRTPLPLQRKSALFFLLVGLFVFAFAFSYNWCAIKNWVTELWYIFFWDTLAAYIYWRY